jgi:putative ABC transport system permease protein
MLRLFNGVEFFIWFVSVTTLLAGALGVSNIMLVSVKERTREFGVRKALGATPLSVVTLVLQEAVLLTALAGYLGLLAGVFGLELSAALATGGGPLGAPGISVGAALIAALVLACLGVISGLAPAVHAARIRPVEALRAE